MSDFASNSANYRQRLEKHLQLWLPPIEPQQQQTAANTASKVASAMHYSLAAGGKRVRPILCYATGAALDVEPANLDAAAVALELIHTYSLIHDDLPAMDDDDLRRGKATCHRKFDEATAILAGDAMQALAFSVLLEDNSLQVAPSTRIKMLQTLATAAGIYGMVGGQAIDIANEGRGDKVSLQELQQMHALKTGALISAAVQMAAQASENVSAAQFENLSQYAQCIGLAFQVQDDVLDVTSSTAQLGKPQGSDQDANKATYTAFYGLDGAKQQAEKLCQQALDAIADFDQKADDLRQLAQFIVKRDN